MDISKSQEDLLNEIFDDDHVSVSEFKSFRDIADKRFEKLANELGRHNDLTAFQKSVDVTVQLMQNTVLDLKRKKLTDLGEAISKDAIKSQLNYIQIASKLFLDRL